MSRLTYRDPVTGQVEKKISFPPESHIQQMYERNMLRKLAAYEDICPDPKELLARVQVVHCEECRFWDSPPSCEGLAKCVTGESGIRYRSRRDFCSKGMPFTAPPKEETQ